MDMIIKFFQNNTIARICLDAYLVLLIVSLLVFLALKIKKVLVLSIIGLLIGLFNWLAQTLDLPISKEVYSFFFASYFLSCVVIAAPEIWKIMDAKSEKNRFELSSTQSTKTAICEAVFHMSQMKVGALITIEHHNTLDEYAKRAIQMNSDISKELLEQIFIKDSPLHDGGVIIRGNKIVCAGAYYTLTQDESLDKTMGSRHRAAVGISEVTDSLTIIVSEETGAVHVAITGMMIAMDTKEKLLDYISSFIGR